MKTAPREHIEAKIINFLYDTKTPGHASQIATHIQETRESTLQIIRRLIKDGTLTAKQDLTLFHVTGETTAYVLAATPPPALIPGSVPPAQPPRQIRRG